MLQDRVIQYLLSPENEKVSVFFSFVSNSFYSKNLPTASPKYFSEKKTENY